MKDKTIERTGCLVVSAAAFLALLFLGTALWAFVTLVQWVTTK